MNKLVKHVFGILFLLSLCLHSLGQGRVRMPMHRYDPINRINRPNPGRRIELVKENFISQKLNLTADQSRAFWPLYRQYIQEQTAVRILKRLNNSDASANGTVQIDKELAYEQQLVEIRKHYRDEFLKVLPPEKVSELYKSEREFNDEAVRILSERSIKAGE